MPSYGECQSAEVDASPEDCFAALTDFEALPSWQGAVREVRVLERDAAGRGSLVEYAVDAKVRTLRYRLRQDYAGAPERLGCTYAGGDFRDFAGEWRFAALDGGGRCRVELDLSIDPGRFVPGPVRGLIADAVMKRALGDLQARFARSAAGAPR
ncbi:type II toxin-antitoxin system RatA family toxin [Conexibacter sp. SYSU D00693]|uniref:type II toxin-antitoxin system RatA family toxin n=1 Tax=Conexibacter sp. SYSU D00693 TaxID=2812560 RepID=UPI00196B0D20|nr:SRPBCC family protein [Conexibacter sp. SYSU D00693]